MTIKGKGYPTIKQLDFVIDALSKSKNAKHLVEREEILRRLRVGRDILRGNFGGRDCASVTIRESK